MSRYRCEDCDYTFDAPTDTETCRCGCGERAWREDPTDRQCLNPRPHGPHEWLADADAATMSTCPGRAAVPVAGGDLRDRIAQALATSDGHTWGPGHDSLPSGLIEKYDLYAITALAVLRRATQPEIKAAVVPAPAGLDRMRALHRDAYAGTPEAGSSCTAGCGAWPCATVRALDEQPTAEPAEFELRSTTDLRAAVLLEARDAAWAESQRLGREMSGDAAYGARAAAKIISRMADEAQQAVGEAHPTEHSWAAELHDPAADEWVPGSRYRNREQAVRALEHGRRVGPTWRDGAPTERRLVCATTTYTVEPADEARQAPVCGDSQHRHAGACDLYARPNHKAADEAQQVEAHTCDNCNGIDPGSCLFNPDRVREAQQAPCGPAPSECDAEAGEPCPNHERQQAHDEGEHAFCGTECDEEQQAEPAGPFGEPEPTQLRWGLDDVMHGDDDSVTVVLSGPAREPYWLELDPERAAVLRDALAGLDTEAEGQEPATPPCTECGHSQTVHEVGEDPVTPGRCFVCDEDDAHHDYQAQQAGEGR
ncbi:hypothetical protein ACFW9D_05980 [Streptomyces sp. NPDC059524]|uniref:hypothetical protein n=1 Tax=Streptomyces sp. NPDC059524 TaxID=3346856 RepID=UPI0036CE2A55